MFKVNNKTTITPFSSVFIVDFEQTNISWERNFSGHLTQVQFKYCVQGVNIQKTIGRIKNKKTPKQLSKMLYYSLFYFVQTIFSELPAT